MTRQRIELERLLDQCGQRIEAAAHVGRLGGQKHFYLAADAQHGWPSTTSRTIRSAAASCAGTRSTRPLASTASIEWLKGGEIVTGRNCGRKGIDSCAVRASLRGRRRVPIGGGGVLAFPGTCSCAGEGPTMTSRRASDRRQA